MPSHVYCHSGSDLLIETVPGGLVVYFLDKIIPFLGHFLSVIRNNVIVSQDDLEKGVIYIFYILNQALNPQIKINLCLNPIKTGIFLVRIGL